MCGAPGAPQEQIVAAQRVVQAVRRGLERQQPLGEQPAPTRMLFQSLHVFT